MLGILALIGLALMIELVVWLGSLGGNAKDQEKQ